MRGRPEGPARNTERNTVSGLTRDLDAFAPRPGPKARRRVRDGGAKAAAWRLGRLAVMLALLAGGLMLLATAASAQQVRIDLGAGQSLSLRTVQLFLLLTLLSLAPGLAIMVTCFPFMVTVLSILRSALGTQQAPPNMMIVALAIFLTWFVMEPVFTEAWTEGVQPMAEGTLTPEEAFAPTIAPFRRFMEGRVDPDTIAALRDAMPARNVEARAAEPPLSLLVPAFLLGEIKRGFEVGFLIFLPFLVIDLVIAAILMSMGMMMVPPAMVSLPFKLAFFVIADGWTLLGGALVRSYGQ